MNNNKKMKIAIFVILSLLVINIYSSKSLENTINEKKKKKHTTLEAPPTTEKSKLENATLDLEQRNMQKNNNGMGFTYTGNDNVKSIDAVAYNYDNKGNSVNQNNSADSFAMSGESLSMRSPKIISKLPQSLEERFENSKSEKVSPELSNYDQEEYYNGQQAIKARSSDCEKFGSDENSCLQNSHCGFCDDTKLCVGGTKQGPIGNCKNFRYFSDPKISN